MVAELKRATSKRILTFVDYVFIFKKSHSGIDPLFKGMGLIPTQVNVETPEATAHFAQFLSSESTGTFQRQWGSPCATDGLQVLGPN